MTCMSMRTELSSDEEPMRAISSSSMSSDMSNSASMREVAVAASEAMKRSACAVDTLRACVEAFICSHRDV